MIIRNATPAPRTRAMAAAVALCAVPAAHAGLYYDRAAFLADPGLTTTASIDFDAYAVGTVLTDQTVSGAMLRSPTDQQLVVIKAADGVRNQMYASSGANVLSPGGSNPSIEDDDLAVMFAVPVRAFGLDVVFDAPDGASFVAVTFRDQAQNVLASEGFIPAPNGAPGYQFVGFVSGTANIASVVFDEFDGSPPDDNVAYDSLVISPAPVPLPAAFWLLGSALGGLGILRRRLC